MEEYKFIATEILIVRQIGHVVAQVFVAQIIIKNLSFRETIKTSIHKLSWRFYGISQCP